MRKAGINKNACYPKSIKTLERHFPPLYFTVMKKVIPLFALCLLCMHCASEGLPGGGPPDREAPRLQFSSVLNGSTNIDSLQNMEFHFSEALNADVAEKNITVFPLGATETQIRVRGRKISISPLQPWEPELVYTIVLGRHIADLRNNALPEPLQFSFTRSADIPRNSIRGRVFDLNEGVTAEVRISRRQHDPDSILSDPEYYTQCDSDGFFAFQYLSKDTFYIAGYVDLDKSNSYQERLDGRLVPTSPFVIPDTGNTAVTELLAVHDNYLPPRLLKVESMYPSVTRLEFTKAAGASVLQDLFTVGGQRPDTVLADAGKYTVYHDPVPGDTLEISILGFTDYLQCQMPDSSLRIPLASLKDTLYSFEQKDAALFITPPPDTSYLSANFIADSDTFLLNLESSAGGIYRVPERDSPLKGTLHIFMPKSAFYTGINTDSLYTVPLQIPGPEENGAVLGSVLPATIDNCRIILKGSRREYETFCRGGAFRFDNVRPGNYRLLYYIDRNRNGRRDFGRPKPYEPPEISYLLDTEISVRSRWDTELSEAYQIDVEN